MPPEATNGIFSSSATRGSRDHVGDVVFARMAAALKPVDTDRIAADPLGATNDGRKVRLTPNGLSVMSPA
jgi:hypothetical protein